MRISPLNEEPVEKSAQQQPFDGEVGEPAFLLEDLARDPQAIGEAEDRVEDAHMVTCHVIGLARANDGRLVPVIDGGHDAAIIGPAAGRPPVAGRRLEPEGIKTSALMSRRDALPSTMD